jgi:hypothetical protein
MLVGWPIQQVLVNTYGYFRNCHPQKTGGCHRSKRVQVSLSCDIFLKCIISICFECLLYMRRRCSSRLPSLGLYRAFTLLFRRLATVDSHFCGYMFSCLVADNTDILRNAASIMMTAASLCRMNLEQNGACLSVLALLAHFRDALALLRYEIALIKLDSVNTSTATVTTLGRRHKSVGFVVSTDCPQPVTLCEQLEHV